jgi:RimJ/RimL family protein N-acetyltransferase
VLRVPLDIRPLGLADCDRVEAAFRQLSDATVQARFLSRVKPRPQLFSWVDELDGHARVAVGASHAESGAPLGLARYVRYRDDPSRAELAITVVDEWQRRGVGTALLHEIARHAARAGITTFCATAFADNRGARALVAKLGAPRFGPVRSGVVSFEVPVFGAAPAVAAA